MRDKYRSAIYTFSDEQKAQTDCILLDLNQKNQEEAITLVLNFRDFKASRDEFTNYYYSNPEKPFCETFINPKLTMLLNDYSDVVNQDKLNHLKVEPTL